MGRRLTKSYLERIVQFMEKYGLEYVCVCVCPRLSLGVCVCPHLSLGVCVVFLFVCVIYICVRMHARRREE